MDNPIVVAVLLAVVVGLVVVLQRQRAAKAKSARGEVDGMAALLDKGQYAEAAQLAIRNDRFAEAVDLYLRANDPARAAQVASRMGNLRQAGELYERAGDSERAALSYDKAGMADRARALRGATAATTTTEGDAKARARDAEGRYHALRAKAAGDPTRTFEVQQAAQGAAEELLAVGEVTRAAELYREADMIDEAVHLYVNVLGTPGAAAPLVAARGFHERAAELYELAGQGERAAVIWADAARKSPDSDKLLDRVEALSLAVANTLLRELIATRPLSKTTAPLHYRYGTVLEKAGEVDRAIEVFMALQGSVAGYRDVEKRVRRLARGEGVSMKAPGVPRDLVSTGKHNFAVPQNTEGGIGREDASRMVREATKAAAARARRASSLPPPAEPRSPPQQVVHITQVVIQGRPGHPDRPLARGLEDSPIGLGALYDDAVRAAKEGPSIESLQGMVGDRPCDLGNIEVFYRLGLAALASGDWSRAQSCFAAVEEASPGYRDAGARVLELAGWQSMLARKMSVVGARKNEALDAATSRYEVKGELGRGGMAVVYRATDTVLGREVALKFLSEELSAQGEMREMFQREARSVAQLNHPNIVTIHDSGVIEGRMFMAMELVEGRTVDAVIEAEGKIAVLEALRVTKQVLEALEFAHERQFIHRDIKPSNMMRSSAGTVKLMDFGLAKSVTQGNKSSMIAGTPAYMPPEQFIGVGVDLRSDLFAVGATLYEMLTGVLPFEGMDRKKRPRPPREITPGVPEMIDKMILQALDFDPDKRFQSAAEFLVPIKRVIFAVDKATRGSPMPEPSSPPETLSAALAAVLSETSVRPLAETRVDVPKKSAPSTEETVAVIETKADPIADPIADAAAVASAETLLGIPVEAPAPPVDTVVEAPTESAAPVVEAPTETIVEAAPPVQSLVSTPAAADGFIEFGAPLTPPPAAAPDAPAALKETVAYDPFEGIDEADRMPPTVPPKTPEA